MWDKHVLEEKDKRRTNPQYYRDVVHRNYIKNPAPHKKRSAENGFKKRYGITLADKEKMFEAQGRVCACCGSSDPGKMNGWHYDHNHETEKGRGVLCGPCNLMLGASQDNVARLEAGASYLRKHNA